MPIILSVITAAGAAYTAYANQKTQAYIETLKANTAEQIKMAELRSQENIIRLKDQLETEKDLRAQSAANESTALSARAKRCDEIKIIRDSMSSELTHLRHNDPRADDALVSLETDYNKLSSYMTRAGFSAINSALPKNKSPDGLQRASEIYGAVLEGYNAELRITCP